jgi:hypothetical protein
MRVFDGSAVASHEDGVHDGQGAADAKDKAEEDTDERAGEKVHDDAMVCSVPPKGSLICASGERLTSYRGSVTDFSGVVLIDAGY